MRDFQLGEVHRVDQRHRFGVVGEVRFFAARDSLQQIDRFVGGGAADFTRFVELSPQDVVIRGNGEQFRRAAKVRDVVAPKRNGGVDEGQHCMCEPEGVSTRSEVIQRRTPGADALRLAN